MFFPPPPAREPASSNDASADLQKHNPPIDDKTPKEPQLPLHGPSASDPGAETPRAHEGSLKLFRLAGTDVYVHWSWFVIAVYMIQDRAIPFSSIAWDIVEYVAGFGIVLLHEFGHVLACKQGGGTAKSILLWPLGGLAFVQPMPRPGALLWTTVAGPLVNLILAPILFRLAYFLAPGEDDPITDLYLLVRILAFFNVLILIFNVLPIYPLDGGRMLHALLWWIVGRSKGLAIASLIGFPIAVVLGIYAFSEKDWWLVAMTVFLGLGAFGGMRRAQLLLPLDQAIRRKEFTCPHCKMNPPAGDFWRCQKCQNKFDIFDPLQTCPTCGDFCMDIPCVECGSIFPGADWPKPQIDQPSNA